MVVGIRNGTQTRPGSPGGPGLEIPGREAGEWQVRGRQWQVAAGRGPALAAVREAGVSPSRHQAGSGER